MYLLYIVIFNISSDAIYLMTLRFLLAVAQMTAALPTEPAAYRAAYALATELS
ncbi:hypothetical protein AAGU66_17235 [Edwardsiella ictaluri]|nr:hypothetical protein [Edwardsiella ictaluri]QPW28302.1 hypothetical protein F8538_17175 [Edwardsiella ictaluri]UCQ47803.1 hypothetical protein DB741_18040 [Edwardsiella ictaluri]UCQ51066.1 hypothetical protein DB731_18035 [Edwardsiella ictaluri]UYB61720.1 hypothetical protein N8I66_17740 [Edwardsiella ictaluri]UYB64945.1 hypothetical protein N8I67_17735 [Edwardsiella ictaluri]